MGVMGMIAKAKGQFHNKRLSVMEGKTAKLQEANIKEAQVTDAKRKLREAQQIKADLRADQMKRVEKAPTQPSKFRKLAKGMASHMNKQKQSGKGLAVGGSGGSPFGGQRNLNVGGEGGGGSENGAETWGNHTAEGTC